MEKTDQRMKVYIRVRPFLPEEKKKKDFCFPVVDVPEKNDTVLLYEFLEEETKTEANIRKMINNQEFFEGKVL